jgi:hypothetical protein
VNNREFIESCVAYGPRLAPELVNLMYDPQTSGGLLVALPAHDAEVMSSRCSGCFTIGRATASQDKPIHLI